MGSSGETVVSGNGRDHLAAPDWFEDPVRCLPEAQIPGTRAAVVADQCRNGSNMK
jgi:hypothetical protein